MAMGDYRYIQFKDESDITELLLYAYPKMITAIVERQTIIENMISASSGSSSIGCGSRTNYKSNIPNNLDAERYDKRLLLLNNIVNAIDNSVVKLRPQQRFFLEDFYWSEEIVTVLDYSTAHGVSRQAANEMRKRVVANMSQTCVNVYPLFCRWRRMDETELRQIKARELKQICDRLDKKKWGDN